MNTRMRPWLLPLLWLSLLGPIASVRAYTVSTTTFQWDTFTGTPLVLHDNEVSGAIALPFSFNFLYDSFPIFLRPHAAVYVSSNGFLTFQAGQSDGCTGRPTPCSGGNLPGSTGPSDLVAGYWEDLNPEAGGTISYGTLGTAPNRRFVVQFDNVPHAPSGNPVSFQIKLFESSNEIEVHCKSCPSDGGAHTQGIEGGQRANGTTNAFCYTTNPALGLNLYGYHCRIGHCSNAPTQSCSFDIDCPGDTCTITATGERNAASFTLNTDAVRFTPPSNRTAIAPLNFSPGTGNIIAVHYDFRVDANQGINGPPQGKLIYVPSRVFGSGSPDNYSYLLESFVRADRWQYTDPVCTNIFGFPPGTFTYLNEAGFVLQIPDYPNKGFIGLKTDQPTSFPRYTSTGAIDGSAAAFSTQAQFNVVGLDGSYEVRRGPIITDKTGWHLVATNCDPQGHCTCQDGGLDPGNPSHAFRQWDTTIVLGGNTYTTHAALPDDSASAIVTSEVLSFLTEFFFTSGQYRVYLWNVKAETDVAPTTWQPVTRWAVGDHDGSTRYFGFRPSSYGGHCVLEASNDPAKQTAYLFGAGAFSTTTFDMSTCAASPTATTGPATSIGSTGATLNGVANDNAGTGGTAWFEYGPAPCDSNPCTPTSPTSTITGTLDTAVSKAVTGLTPGTYHFRIVAQNAGGTVKGADQTFATTTTSGRLAPTTYAVTARCAATNVSGASITATLNLRGQNGNLIAGGTSVNIAAGATQFISANIPIGSMARCEVVAADAPTSSLRVSTQGVKSADSATGFQADDR